MSSFIWNNFTGPAGGEEAVVAGSHMAKGAVQVPDLAAWQTHQAHVCVRPKS